MASVMQKANTLRAALGKGNGLSFGAWQMLPGTHLSRAIARSGMDWVLVDCEHGNISGESRICYCLLLRAGSILQCPKEAATFDKQGVSLYQIVTDFHSRQRNARVGKCNCVMWCESNSSNTRERRLDGQASSRLGCPWHSRTATVQCR